MDFDKLKYYEFFAGVGMARFGLGGDWQCLFANDCDLLKKKSYLANWTDKHFDARDVGLIHPDDLIGRADLAWASFPCQDLSLAGSRAGIGEAEDSTATRSGAVWPFLNIMRLLAKDGRHPLLLALENVVGLLSVNSGDDFRTLCGALTEIGYRFGAIVADASHFVPQSRPRVFIVAVRTEVPIPAALQAELPQAPWHSQPLVRARAGLAPSDAANWVWWSLGSPPAEKEFELEDIIDLSEDADWNTADATERFIGMMSQSHLDRLKLAKAQGRPVIGSLYLRMRPNGKDGNIQRAEIAFGPTLGCLRTPKGGASRPRIIVVHGDWVRTRLLSISEAALLMGLGTDFILPTKYNECFRLIGDGVVPPVVRLLAERLLEPLARHARSFAGATTDQKATA